jgi:signal transduction histidine kinase
METGGFGLKGMQERIATLNGSLSIETEQQKGTQVSAVIPLKTLGLELSS